jgi:hypothetical protein
MLQKLGRYVAEALDHAAAAEERAATETDTLLRSDYRNLATHWRRVAQCYEFIDSVDRFLLESQRYAQGEQTPELTPEHCRLRATDCERKAEALPDQISIHQYQELAEEWRQLANDLEMRPGASRRPAQTAAGTSYLAKPCPTCGRPMSIQSVEPSLARPMTDEITHWCVTCKMDFRQKIRRDS